MDSMNDEERTEVEGQDGGEPRPRGLTRLDLLVSGLVGAAGAGLLMMAFPSTVLPRITHGMLRLPGPGSGVAVIGPFFALVVLLNYVLLRKPGAVLFCGAVLGLLHSIFMQELFPAAKTVGTVGPMPLRILAVVALAAVLEGTVWLLARCRRWLRDPVSAASGSLAFLVFYWAALYPLTGKRAPKPATYLILGAVTLVAGAVAGGLLPAALDRPRRQR
jgi:asparagine N-glycosylation enzyme membrane subunit Stt3